MKILLITPVDANQKSGDPLPLWQPQNFWVRALKNLGHRVTVFDYTKASLYKAGRIDRKFTTVSPEIHLRNKKLSDLIIKLEPELTIVSAGSWMIKKETIALCKSFGKVSLFSGVSPVVYNSVIEISYLPYIDLVVTNDPLHEKQWQKLGAKKTLTLPISAIDKELVSSVKSSNSFRSDMAFVGSLFDDRQQQLLDITKKIPKELNFKIWGYLPKGKIIPELKKYYQGSAYGEKLISIYKSAKIGLNLSPTHMNYSGNIRPFEITASGALLLSDKLNLDYFKDKTEAIEFKSFTHLSEIASDLKTNPNKYQKIIKAGKKRTLAAHTYKHRFQKLIKFIESL